MVVPVGVALTTMNTSKMTGAMTGNDYEIFTLEVAEVSGQEVGGVVAGGSPFTRGEAAFESGFRFIAAGCPVAALLVRCIAAAQPGQVRILLSNAKPCESQGT
jgi:hypothetical protein